MIDDDLMPVFSCSRSLLMRGNEDVESVEYAFRCSSVEEAGSLHVLGHLPAAAEIVDKRLVEQRLVIAGSGWRAARSDRTADSN